MKLFIDSGDVGEIREAHAIGFIDGDHKSVAHREVRAQVPGRGDRDLELIDGPISAEVLTTSYPEMIAEARDWHTVHKNVVVMLPLTLDGLRACARAR